MDTAEPLIERITIDGIDLPVGADHTVSMVVGEEELTATLRMIEAIESSESTPFIVSTTASS